MQLDIQTLLFVSSLVSATSALLFMLDVSRHADQPGYQWWGLAFIFTFVSGLAFGMAAVSAPWLFALGNGFAMLACAMLWVGARRISGRTTHIALWGGPPAVIVVGTLLFAQPYNSWSGFAPFSLAVSVYVLLAAWACWRPAGPRLQNHVVLATVWGLAGLFYLARTIGFVVNGPAESRFASGTGAEVATIAVLLLIVISSFSMAALGKEMSELELHKAATRDGLTGLLNRSEFARLANRALENAAQSHSDVAMLLLDMDHFKRINDTFGHAVGDQVLVAGAHAVTRCLRSDDLFCRYGGEEFAVFLPNVSPIHARLIAERIIHAMRLVAINAEPGTIKPTISIGMSSGLYDLSDLLTKADSALYRAKDAGRDQLVISEAA